VPRSAFRFEQSQAAVLWWPVCKTVGFPRRGFGKARILGLDLIGLDLIRCRIRPYMKSRRRAARAAGPAHAWPHPRRHHRSDALTRHSAPTPYGSIFPARPIQLPDTAWTAPSGPSLTQSAAPGLLPGGSLSPPRGSIRLV